MNERKRLEEIMEQVLDTSNEQLQAGLRKAGVDPEVYMAEMKKVFTDALKHLEEEEEETKSIPPR